jgi:hypothetical protein
VTDLRMGLLASRHDDDVSAALSIAANRASKVRKLLDAGQDWQVSMARRFLDSLEADVEDFLKSKRGKRACERSTCDLPLELRRMIVVERALLPKEEQRMNDDFLSLETRKVLNGLGNAGSIIEWYAVCDDDRPVEPSALTDGDDPDPNSVIVIWPDETATLITTAHTEDPR